MVKVHMRSDKISTHRHLPPGEVSQQHPQSVDLPEAGRELWTRSRPMKRLSSSPSAERRSRTNSAEANNNPSFFSSSSFFSLSAFLLASVSLLRRRQKTGKRRKLSGKLRHETTQEHKKDPQNGFHLSMQVAEGMFPNVLYVFRYPFDFHTQGPFLFNIVSFHT